jgi:hypothetical protein
MKVYFAYAKCNRTDKKLYSIRCTSFTTVQCELGHESSVSLQTVDSRGGGSDESRGDETSRTSQRTRGS